MRIALLVTQLEPGGAQRVALEIAAGLRERGHVVETWFFYEKVPAFSGTPGVRVLLGQQPRSLRSLVALTVALKRAFATFTPDATISFTHYANVFGSICALRAGIPRRIASQQNPLWTYPRLARWADLLCGALGVYTTNIAVSRAVLNSFHNTPASYKRASVCVPNGSRMVPSAMSKADARRLFGLPDNEFVALAVGRLHCQKNHAVLLHALPTAPAVHLAIAGEGELREELESLAASLGVGSRVRFLGAVTSDAMSALLQTADIFVMPSRFEGLSLALLEALAAGLPIVSSDIPSQVEVLTTAGGNACALLMRCDDTASWAAALRRLSTDHALRRDLGVAAARRARDFSLERTVSGYESALATVP